jgi:hypothetical protein
MNRVPTRIFGAEDSLVQMGFSTNAFRQARRKPLKGVSKP